MHVYVLILCMNYKKKYNCILKKMKSNLKYFTKWIHKIAALDLGYVHEIRGLKIENL